MKKFMISWLYLTMNSFQDFLYFLGTTILSGTSEWLLPDYVLHLHLYNNFEVFSLLILIFFYFDLPIFTQSAEEIFLFLKFYVLREGSNFIASFLEHPVCSNFKMHNILLLVFLFWFATINPKSMSKVNFSWNFRCSAKEAVILFLSWNTLYIAFPKCILSRF